MDEDQKASMNDAPIPVLDVRDVHKRFVLHLRGGLELAVLQGFSLTVKAGECVALTGPSGRGKSTLMKCLHGSYRVDRGQLWLSRDAEDRIDLAQASAQQLIGLRRAEIGYVSQFLRALPRVPALDVVAERWLHAHDRSTSAGIDATDDADIDPFDDARHDAVLEAAREEARALLIRLNLPEGLWNLPPATFSGGEQQRINIARGFVQPSRLLLLDEPTASLDAGNRRVVIGLIDDAKRRGAAVVGIFHDEEVREAVADRCVEVGAPTGQRVA